MVSFSIIVILVLCLDQLTKHLILSRITVGQSLPIIENIFHLTLVKNSGIAFGLFPQGTNIFIIFSFLVIFLILIILWKKKELKILPRIALALILAGAIGNLIDRLRWGYVIDFLDFRIWPVFNLADTSITIGVILLSVYLFRS